MCQERPEAPAHCAACGIPGRECYIMRAIRIVPTSAWGAGSARAQGLCPFEEGGHRDVSITEVARRAGSSVGGFYARFRSKDELLRALEEYHLELRVLLDALAAPETWREASPHQIGS